MKFSDLQVLRDNLPTLEKEVQRIVHIGLKDRKMQVLISPNLPIDQIDYDGMRFSRRYLDLATLVIVLHYSEYFGEFSGYLQYEIERYLEKQLLFPDIRASLYEPKLALFILLSQSNWSTRKLFGSILNKENITRVLNLVSLRILKPQKIVYPIRRRGYKDKGTLRLRERWLPSQDLYFDEEERKIEDRKAEYFDKVQTLLYEAGGWVLRNHLMSNSTKGGDEDDSQRKGPTTRNPNRASKQESRTSKSSRPKDRKTSEAKS